MEEVKPAAAFTLCLAYAFLVAAYGQKVLDSKADALKRRVEIKHLRGVVVDSKWAVIPKVQATLRRQDEEDFRDIKSVETDESGRFEFGEMTDGTYLLVFAAPTGFCHVSIPIKLSAKGWEGLKLTVPVLATDSPGYCKEHSKVESINAKTH